MKQIIKIYLILAVTCCCSSCGDFFDQVPDDRLSIEQVFQRKQYSEDYLAGVYTYIRDESYRARVIPWDGCSDDVDVTYDRAGDSYDSYSINLGKWNAASDYYNNWDHFYKGIRSATYFMQHIGGNAEILAMRDGQKLIAQYRAEARFLRAFFYYNLMRQYGPVVLLGDEMIAPDLSASADEMKKARSPYDVCVDYIVSELDSAALNLPLHFTEQGDNDYGRATKMMCMATKSRMLLLAASPQFNGNSDYTNFKNNDGTLLTDIDYKSAKWKRAADAAYDIIKLDVLELYKEYGKDGKLDPYLSCRNVMLEPWNKEVIFARKTNSMNSWEKSITPRYAGGYESMGVTQQLVDEFEMENGRMIGESGSGYVETGFSTVATAFAPKGTYNMYVNREPRFYVNVTFDGGEWINPTFKGTNVGLYYSGNSGKKGSWDYPRTGYICRKNMHPNSDVKNGKYVARPLVLMRYAEIILNYVEALNEYDPGNPDILTYLNMIRARAGVSKLTASYDAKEMQRRIRHERRVELALENLRYFDTRRWKIAEQTDGGPFYGMNVDGGGPSQDGAFYKRTVFERRVFKKSYYLFPIPQSEINRSENLVQNPGW